MNGNAAWKTLGTLARHLWPRGRWDLRARVVAALAALAAAKGVNVYVPLLYKQAVDALSPRENALVAVPVALIVAYGLARVLQQAFGELRDLLFARVSQHAQRVIALETFRHLHELSLFNILPTLLETLSSPSSSRRNTASASPGSSWGPWCSTSASRSG